MNPEKETATKVHAKKKMPYVHTTANIFDSNLDTNITPAPRKIIRTKVGMRIDGQRVEEVTPFMVRLSNNRWITLGELVAKKLEPISEDSVVDNMLQEIPSVTSAHHISAFRRKEE